MLWLKFCRWGRAATHGACVMVSNWDPLKDIDGVVCARVRELYASPFTFSMSYETYGDACRVVRELLRAETVPERVMRVATALVDWKSNNFNVEREIQYLACHLTLDLPTLRTQPVLSVCGSKDIARLWTAAGGQCRNMRSLWMTMLLFIGRVTLHDMFCQQLQRALRCHVRIETFSVGGESICWA